MHIKGGFARGNSVTFLSESYVATAKRNKDGSVTVKTRRRPFTNDSNRIYKALAKIPFFRSIISLMTIIFQSKAIAIVITLAIVLVFMPESTTNALENTILTYLDILVSLAGFIIVFFTFYKFGAIRKYHGAEHKAANAYARTGEISVEAARRASRVHERCGTNHLVVALCVAAIIQLAANWEIDYSLLVGMAVAGEVARLKNGTVKKPFYLIGGFLQKHLLTAEPGDRELEVAIAALNSLQMNHS